MHDKQNQSNCHHTTAFRPEGVKMDWSKACTGPSQQQLPEGREEKAKSLPHLAEPLGHSSQCTKNGSLLPVCAKADAKPAATGWAEHCRHCKAQAKEQPGWGHPGRARLQSSAPSDTGAFSGASEEKPRAVGESPALEVLNKCEDVAPEGALVLNMGVVLCWWLNFMILKSFSSFNNVIITLI